ncbi:MAG: NADH-quinone oxidoreductase subunit NuoN [Steroidobacteraceae bacterium]
MTDLMPALPEMYLAGAICLLVLFDLFIGEKKPSRNATFTLLLLVIGAGLTAYTADWGTSRLLFSGLYVADDLGIVLKLAAFLFVAIGLYYANGYLARRGLQKGEYYVLTLTALLGILVLGSAGNLITVYIGIELLSLSLYALVAFDRENGIAAEAAMKYFVLGAIASGTLLYGMSLVYGLTGSLDLGEIAQALQGEPSLGLILGLAFLVVATAFKFGAAPFHMWVPDVYHGAPTSVTLLVATAPKIASFALAYRLLASGLGEVSGTWAQMLAIIAVLSIALGNVVAVAQTNLRRMLAYSAVANVGFILLGFVTGGAEGYEAALYYTLAYVVMVLGAFGVMLLASRDGFEADELEHYKGLHARDPSLAAIMAVMMFSTAGIPPFVGFWAKLAIINSVVAAGHTYLAIAAVVLSVIGAFYYLRIVWLMYFEAPGSLPKGEPRFGVRFVLGINALVVIAFGLMPDTLIALCRQVIPGG